AGTGRDSAEGEEDIRGAGLVEGATPGFHGEGAGGSVGSLLRHGRACPGHPRIIILTASKTWMPGHQGVYARLRRTMAGHDVDGEVHARLDRMEFQAHRAPRARRLRRHGRGHVDPDRQG